MGEWQRKSECVVTTLWMLCNPKAIPSSSLVPDRVTLKLIYARSLNALNSCFLRKDAMSQHALHLFLGDFKYKEREII